jgi:HK97 gp10 family phage protein
MAVPGRAGRMPTVSVEGAEALRSTLESLPAELQSEIRGRMHTAGRQIEQEARDRVPKKSRDLLNSIGYRVSDSGLSVEVGSRGVAYAAHVEWGTRKMKAIPWLYPAFRVGVKTLRRGLRETMADLPRKTRTRVTRDKRTRAK